MRTAEALLKQNGGLKTLIKKEFIRVSNSPGQVLELQACGEGPGRAKFVAVTFFQVPDELGGCRRMSFEIHSGGGPWIPVYFRDESSGEELQVYSVKEHLTLINTEVCEELLFRAAEWDRELKEMGFLEADQDGKYYPLFKGA